MSRFAPIHHTFAPHIDLHYLRETVRILTRPRLWKTGTSHEKLRIALSTHFKADVFLFSSGREALLALFRSMKLKKDEEVLLPGFTCVVVPNAIKAAGLTPRFVDIDPETLNIDIEDLKSTLSSNSRVILSQHTFGIPDDVCALRAICDRHSLFLIEDCAHIIPDETGPHEVGMNGDAAMVSFGRDKAISGITGGALIVRNPELTPYLAKEEAQAAALSRVFIFRLLLYPLLYSIARPFIGIGIGKGLLKLCQHLSLLIPIVSGKEKEGSMTSSLHTLPNACAALALFSFKKLRTLNDHRRTLTHIYQEYCIQHDIPLLPILSDSSIPLLKFPLFVTNAKHIRRSLKKKNIHLDDGWSGCVISPPGTVLDAVDYIPGSDPEAEKIAQSILTLPTHPTMTDSQAHTLLAELSQFTLIHRSSPQKALQPKTALKDLAAVSL